MFDRRRRDPFAVSLSTFALGAIVCTAIVLATGCAGGGCAGVTPLPAGFPNTETIDHAAVVRVTRAGLDFLGDHAGDVATKLLGASGSSSSATPGTIAFPLGSSSTSTSFGFFSFTIDVCPNGPDATTSPPKCIAEIGLGQAHLHVDAVTPNAVVVTGTIPVRLQDLPAHVTLLGDVDLGMGSGQCNGATPAYDFRDLPVNIVLPLVTETRAPRAGYTKVDVANAQIDVTLTSGDVGICKDCGLISSVCDGLYGFMKDLAFSQISSAVQTQLRSALAAQMCRKPDPTLTPACPDGTQADGTGATCVFTADPATCVPVTLGTDGHADLSQLMASISPGTHGGLDFGLAAGGDADPAPGAPADGVGWPTHTPNGLTLGMIGGTRAMPASACVPAFTNALPTGIPIPDELETDAPAGWNAASGAPHVGIAIAGRFLDHALGGVYQSGMLCLDVSTDKTPLLNTGVLSAIIPSLKALTFDRKPAAAAIVTHPHAPPTTKIGGGTDANTDPLVTITLPKLGVDFYVWSDDRFVRAFTFEADVTIPMVLESGKAAGGGANVLPSLGKVGLANVVVTNADFLTDDPAAIGKSLANLLGAVANQLLGGAIPAFDLGSAFGSLGLTMTVPDGAFHKLTKGSDDFVALYAQLSEPVLPVKTLAAKARLVGKSVDPAAMGLARGEGAAAPEVVIAAEAPDAPAGAAIEYAWRVDGGLPSAWTRDATLHVRADDLFLQGKHVVHVAARVVGAPATEGTSADVPVAIDVLAPHVRAARGADGAVHVDAYDLVSGDDALVARARRRAAIGDLATPFGAWGPVATIAAIAPEGAAAVDVEVRDEEGNVGVASVALGAAAASKEAPGASAAAASGGCACSTTAPGGGAGGAGAIAAIGLILAELVRRRRGRATKTARAATTTALATTALVAIAGAGCGSGDGPSTSVSPTTPGDDGGAPTKTGCGADCNSACAAPLDHGVVGAYTSVATGADGAIWVAGYDDAVFDGATTLPLGDLVVGRWDAAANAVAWTSVDGLPPARTDGTCPDRDPNGFRRGETDPGDDVGLWTSLRVDPNGHPAVAYFDATHAALKFAAFDGHAWSAHTVLGAPGLDAGRYAKLVYVGKTPTIAFLAIDRSPTAGARSRVVVARGPSDRAPTAAADWTFEDVAVDATAPCRASVCTASEACTKDVATCVPTSTTCAATCNQGEACVVVSGAAACHPTTAFETTPTVFGDYVAVDVDPAGALGVVVYDAAHGDVVGLRKNGATWTKTILAGGAGLPASDVGVGASLAIDAAGDWHVTFVDAVGATLDYVRVAGGATPGAVEVVDDGSALGGVPFADGAHRVGDDSRVRVDPSGAIVVAYQDATAGTLRIATKPSAKGGGAAAWTAHAVAQPGKLAGFFPAFVGGSGGVVNFWRRAHAANGTPGVTGDVSLVTP